MTKHDELIKDLIERAAIADLEGTATACADARYFRQSVAAINELRSEADARLEAWMTAIEATAQVADNYADADYCAMGYPEDGGIDASGTADQIRREIRAMTPPTDISTALDAKLDEAFRAGAEAMREEISRLPKRSEPLGGQFYSYVRVEDIALLPIQERKKGGAE